jgi:DNA-binding PadR family transcriptional regulator
MKEEFICKIKHSRNFVVALQILAEMKRNCGTISISELENFTCQHSTLDKESLKLWLYTLLGSGYIEKLNLPLKREEYSLTPKGEKEVIYHASIENHKMFIQSIT